MLTNKIRRAMTTSGFVTVLVLLPIQVSFGQQSGAPPSDTSGHHDFRPVGHNVAVGNSDLGCPINGGATLRVEYRLAESKANDVSIRQTAVVF